MAVQDRIGWWLLGMLLLTAPVLAQQQPPEAALIRRMDVNGDGLLDSREIPAQARSQIARLAREARLNVNEPLPIGRIERQLRRTDGGSRDDDDDDRDERRGRRGEDRGGGERRRGERGGGERGRGDWREEGPGGGGRRGGPWGDGPRGGQDPRQADWRGRTGQRDERDARPTQANGTTVDTADPRFAFGAGEGSRVRGFGPADVVPPPLEEQYDERTLRFVDRILSRSDRNENGRLESSEWEGMRWMGNPQDSDTNKDGVLTREELAGQMASRFGQRDSENSTGRGGFEGRPPFGGGFPGGPGMAAGEGRFGRGDGEGRFARGPRSGGEGPFGGGERRFGGAEAGSGDGDRRFAGRFNRDEGEIGEGRRRGGRDSGRRGGGDENESGDRIRGFAEMILRRYDRNENGKLEREEWSEMRERYAAADANKDSTITVDELAGHLANARREGGGFGWGPRPEGPNEGSDGRTARGRDGEPSNDEQKKSYRFLSPAERIEAILSGRDREWFLERDRDGDGQIAMSEFSDAWTAEKIDEFAGLDANTDGVVTPHEYLQSRSD